MKVLYSLATATAAGLASFFPSGATRSANEQTFRFMSYNFRYDSKPDNVTVQQTIDSLPQGLPATPTVFYPNTDELPWSTRRIGITNEILFPRTDILGKLSYFQSRRVAKFRRRRPRGIETPG